MSTGGGDES